MTDDGCQMAMQMQPELAQPTKVIGQRTYLLLEHVEVINDNSNEQIESKERAADNKNNKIYIRI